MFLQHWVYLVYDEPKAAGSLYRPPLWTLHVDIGSVHDEGKGCRVPRGRGYLALCGWSRVARVLFLDPPRQ